MSTDLKLPKAKISKIIKFRGFLGSLLSKLAGPLTKVAVPLAKNILAPLGITVTASVIDAGIQKKIHSLGTTMLMISNKEMNDIMKIFKLLKTLIFYWKESLKQLKMKQKNKMKIFKYVAGCFRS